MAPCIIINRDESMLHLKSRWDYYTFLTMADLLGFDNHFFGPDSEAWDPIERLAFSLTSSSFTSVPIDAMPIKSMEHYA